MSVYYNLLSGIQSQLATVLTNSIVRLTAVLYPSDTYPLVLISPGQEGEQVAEVHFQHDVWWNYPVEVVLFEAGNRLEQTALSTYMQLREDIRNKLFVLPPNVGVSQVFDVNIIPDAASAFPEALATNYHITKFVVWYRTDETIPAT